MTSKGKMLSSAESTVLLRLATAGGSSWSSSDRPLWESRYWTIHLLNTLASKGLVTEVEPDREYRVSTQGFLVIEGR